MGSSELREVARGAAGGDGSRMGERIAAAVRQIAGAWMMGHAYQRRVIHGAAVCLHAMHVSVMALIVYDRVTNSERGARSCGCGGRWENERRSGGGASGRWQSRALASPTPSKHPAPYSHTSSQLGPCTCHTHGHAEMWMRITDAAAGG